jgi:isoquinoline 1-oxidoreductase beta subunit
MVPSVVDVKPVSSGVAVYATGFWPARKGREALRVTWDEANAEKRSTEQLIEEYRALARRPGDLVNAKGDADPALARADRVIEAEFVFPYLAHAPMEPLDGYLLWNSERAVARLGSQLQTGDHMTMAHILGLSPDKVEIETMLAGGSFGRRAQPSMHLAAELAEVAKAIGPDRPVKLVWTREDDVRGGYYRSIFVHRMRAGLRDGKIAAWTSTSVGQSILKGSPFEALAMKNGIDPTSVEGANELPYDIADFRCDLHTTQVGVPVLWWRSVGHSHTGYAVECFVDEVLEATGQDPVAGRLALMSKAPRAAGVLRAVADLARWSGPGPVNGRARGVAVVESFDSFIAQIAEVSAESGGEPKVHKVWCAVDCGVPVNPDIIRAQMEGGIGFGLGHALFAEITLDEGRPVPGNFDAYRSLRIHEMPEVEVTVLPSTEKPTGVGEPGVPPIGPAVANAMARLGLGRPRRLPIVRGEA